MILLLGSNTSKGEGPRRSEKRLIRLDSKIDQKMARIMLLLCPILANALVLDIISFLFFHFIHITYVVGVKLFSLSTTAYTM